MLFFFKLIFVQMRINNVISTKISHPLNNEKTMEKETTH